MSNGRSTALGAMAGRPRANKHEEKKQSEVIETPVVKEEPKAAAPAISQEKEESLDIQPVPFKPKKKALKVDKKEHRLQLVLKKKLFDLIKEEARNSGMSANAYVTQIIAYYFKSLGKYDDID